MMVANHVGGQNFYHSFFFIVFYNSDNYFYQSFVLVNHYFDNYCLPATSSPLPAILIVTRYLTVKFYPLPLDLPNVPLKFEKKKLSNRYFGRNP